MYIYIFAYIQNGKWFFFNIFNFNVRVFEALQTLRVLYFLFQLRQVKIYKNRCRTEEKRREKKARVLHVYKHNKKFALLLQE